jgi:hypothetical protein
MHIILLRQFGQRLLALDRRQRHFRLEGRGMGSANSFGRRHPSAAAFSPLSGRISTCRPVRIGRLPLYQLHRRGRTADEWGFRGKVALLATARRMAPLHPPCSIVSQSLSAGDPLRATTPVMPTVICCYRPTFFRLKHSKWLRNRPRQGSSEMGFRPHAGEGQRVAVYTEVRPKQAGTQASWAA